MNVYRDHSNQRRTTQSLLAAPREDAFASVVVFLVALPLCMGIAIASGVPVAAGLVTGIVGGIIVGYFAGAPLQVSGPAAGLTIVVYEFVQSFGWESLGIAVLIAGCLQLVAGVLRLGQWFRAISPAVVQGMLAGIGVLILCSQIHVMVDDSPKKSGLANLVTIPAAVEKGMSLPEWQSTSERQFRSKLLKQTGVLHEELNQIASSLVDRNSSSLEDPKARQGIAVNQEDVAQQFDQLAAAVNQFSSTSTSFDQSGEVQKIAAEVQQQIAASTRSLERGDVTAAQQASLAAGESLGELRSALKDHSWAAKAGLLTLVILLVWSRFAPGRLRRIPAALVAIGAVTVLTATLHLPVLSVDVPDNLWDELRFPTLTRWQRVPTVELIRMGVVIAIVASAETLLCATAVDQLQQRSRTDYDRELTAQGIGNIVCGVLGALPMTGVIARSAANVESGAQTRLSAILHGLWLLIFVSSLAFLLRMIPTAALAAMLVYTGYKLINPQAVRKLLKYGWGEVAVYAVTLITIVTTDLLTGVTVGFALAAARLLYRFSRLQVTLESHDAGSRTVLKIAGAATFLRLPQLAAELERVPPDTELHLDFEHLDHIDHACLDLLLNWARQHESQGGSMVIDWDSLHATFHGESRTGATNTPWQRNAA